MLRNKQLDEHLASISRIFSQIEYVKYKSSMNHVLKSYTFYDMVCSPLINNSLKINSRNQTNIHTC